MLYNGIDLPGIDQVWDNWAYPYAYIMEISPGTGTGGVYGLMLSSVELYKADELGYYPRNNGQVQSYSVNGTLDGWDLLVTTSMDTSTKYFMTNNVVWCSHDLVDETGSLVLRASDPQTEDSPFAILAGTLMAIGAAIRAKRGTTDKYKPGEMAAAIEGIQGEAEQPTVTSIDYSSWDSGSFKETLDNGATLEYAVEFDDGKPVKVTGPDGTETLVDWGNG